MNPFDTEMPKVEIGAADDPSLYGIMGWEEFEQWCRCNMLEWHKASSEAQYIGMDEVDSMRWLIYYLSTSCQNYKKALIERINHSTMPLSTPIHQQSR